MYTCIQANTLKHLFTRRELKCVHIKEIVLDIASLTDRAPDVMETAGLSILHWVLELMEWYRHM
jgi:hypothetical protein